LPRFAPRFVLPERRPGELIFMIVCVGAKPRSSYDFNVISRRWSRIRETTGGILSGCYRSCSLRLTRGTIGHLARSKSYIICNDPYIRRGRLALSSLKLGREGHSHGTTAITSIEGGCKKGEGGSKSLRRAMSWRGAGLAGNDSYPRDH